MSLADYLAKNYLTADPPADKKSKKRKRKGTKHDSGLIIADDDIAGWNNNSADQNDEDTPVIVGETTSTRKSKKKSSTSTSTPWKTFGSAAPSTSTQIALDAEKEAADAIINSVATSRAAAADAEDEAPEMVDAENHLKMESGAHAGLQTAAQVEAAVKKRRAEEKRKAAEVAQEAGPTETVYRDASGRRIDVQMKRAEARKKAEEEERKKLEKEREARGDVQRLEAEKKREALKDAKYLTVARYKDDVALNEEMKDQDRWNDPAAGFLVKKKAGRSVTGKPLYKGAAPPNRYGIRPGYRWDGVDRGTGFENEWFKARNRRGNREALEYAWQMDE